MNKSTRLVLLGIQIFTLIPQEKIVLSKMVVLTTGLLGHVSRFRFNKPKTQWPSHIPVLLSCFHGWLSARDWGPQMLTISISHQTEFYQVMKTLSGHSIQGAGKVWESRLS